MFYYTELILLCAEQVFESETISAARKALVCSIRRVRSQGMSLSHTEGSAFTGAGSALPFPVCRLWVEVPPEMSERTVCHVGAMDLHVTLWKPLVCIVWSECICPLPFQTSSLDLPRRFTYRKPSKVIELTETFFQTSSFSSSVHVP